MTLILTQGAISCFLKVGRSCSHLSSTRGVARVYSGLSESVAFGLMMHKLIHMLCPGYPDYWVQNELKNSFPKDHRLEKTD